MANEFVPATGTKEGCIMATSHKGKVFEVEVCCSTINQYTLVVPDHLMYIINRAIEYERNLVGMEVSIDFGKQTLEIFVCSDLAIKVAYLKITPINIFC